ncbi:putative sugar kinase YdjE [Caldalkalibacillus thermarum]|uniref:carbohydrate kinase family protein n=1 Tax=Caldalkalibacillus thermarum TaxID=296745 RepID=UPI00166EC518|nr:carbohydrate kinase [Caldalkalibacillus thermarum]GGK30132.1 putative sugar kinase YdjE [Caldalkalibacillus thermarum]
MKTSAGSLVVTIGELLIDFFCTDVDVDLSRGTHFVKQAGGAPANVAASVAKLGGQAAFVGKVGHDPFGSFLKQVLDEQQVDTSMLVMDKHAPTTLAFVSLTKEGERDFVFNRGADGLLNYDELDLKKIRQAKVIHFGSATALLDKPFRDTYLRLMEEAKDNGQLVSFDPNYRGDLWKGRTKEFVRLTRQALSQADFVKVSAEELEVISGTNDPTQGVQRILQLGPQAVTVTLGKEGTFLSAGEQQTLVESIPVKAVDATGAGDAFVGAVLFQLARLDDPLQALGDMGQMKEIVAFANRVGALVCTKIGAMAALPSYDEVMKVV